MCPHIACLLKLCLALSPLLGLFIDKQADSICVYACVCVWGWIKGLLREEALINTHFLLEIVA